MLLAKDGVFLNSEDRIRMARLYEEVVTRLEEMALITTRTLKLNAGVDYAVRFKPVEPGSEPSTVEIVSAEGRSGWYDYRAGACYQTEDQEIPK